MTNFAILFQRQIGEFHYFFLWQFDSLHDCFPASNWKNCKFSLRPTHEFNDIFERLEADWQILQYFSRPINKFCNLFCDQLTNFVIFPRDRLTNSIIFSHDRLTNFSFFSQPIDKFCDFFPLTICVIFSVTDLWISRYVTPLFTKSKIFFLRPIYVVYDLFTVTDKANIQNVSNGHWTLRPNKLG